MVKKNWLTGRDRELYELAEQYEKAQTNQQPLYLDASDWADLADWYAMHHKYDMAFKAIEYGLSLHPDNTELLIELAYLYIDEQQIDKAQATAERITEDFLDEVKILKANLLLINRQTQAAEKLLDTIEDKDNMANVTDIVYMYIDTGYPRKALEWLKPRMEIYENEEAFLATTADCYYNLGWLKKAAELYNRLIDESPYNASYWYGLARCYYDQSNFEKAIEACDFALTADEDFAEAYVMRGNAFAQLGNDESAIENYHAAEKYDAISPYFVNIVDGMHLVDLKKWDEAYRKLQKAIDTNQNDEELGNLYAYAAVCLYRMGYKEKAEEYFHKAQELEPSEPDFYLMESHLHLEEYQYDKAIKAWNAAASVAPTAETWNVIGLMCFECGELKYAAQAFERVKEISPKDPKVDLRLQVIYLLLHDEEHYEQLARTTHTPLSEEDVRSVRGLIASEVSRDTLPQSLRQIFKYKR